MGSIAFTRTISLHENRSIQCGTKKFGTAQACCPRRLHMRIEKNVARQKNESKNTRE